MSHPRTCLLVPLAGLLLAASLPGHAALDLFRQAAGRPAVVERQGDRCPTAVERYMNAKGEAVSLNFTRDGVFLVKPDGSQTRAPDGKYVGAAGQVVEVKDGVMHGAGGGGGAGKVAFPTDQKPQVPAGKN